MAQLAAPLAIASSIIGAGQTIMGGLQADAEGKAQQKMSRYQSNATRAVAQRRMIQQSKEGDLQLSRAIARAAASGGGGLETEGFSNVAGGIIADAHEKALMELWQGEQQARQQDYTGDLARFQGRQKKQDAFIRAGMSLLNTASSMAGNIGGGAPGATAQVGLGAARAGASGLAAGTVAPVFHGVY